MWVMSGPRWRRDDRHAPEIRGPPLSTDDGKRIYLLAFDHRGSFQRMLLGIAGEVTPADVARIEEATQFIFAGFGRALCAGLLLDGAGILVDERFGAGTAREAAAENAAEAGP